TASPPTCSSGRRSSSRSRTRSRASAGTPRRAAATSRRRWRPGRSSRSRCSSTSATGSRWTPARARTCRVRRSEQRRAAVFALYQHDLTRRPLDDLFEPGTGAFTRALAHATSDHADEFDSIIERHAHNWTIDRIAPLEKAILRAALLEMLHPDLL